MRPSLWFVTPAHGRHRLTRICLEQRAWACDRLAEMGIDANAVVIACDENLDTAAELGFATVERDNRWLGRRFNDGHEFAAETGVDYVFPIGSDAWVDPAYFEQLPDKRTLRLSRWYALYPPDGAKRGEMRVTAAMGVAFVIPTALLAPYGNRPCDEGIGRGCDTSTFRRVTARARTSERTGHPLELVSFQSAANQISRYSRLMGRWGMREVEAAPFAALKRIYPERLVRQVQAYYADGAPGL